MEFDRYVDVRGQCCGEPIRRLAKELQGLRQGQILLAEADKESLLRDIPAFCRVRGDELVSQVVEEGVGRFWIRRA